MSDCYDRASGSGAYALGALSAEEKAEFEAALAESEELRAEVAGLADTAALLALGAAPVQPSAGMKESLLAALDSTPQAPAEAEPEAAARTDTANGDSADGAAAAAATAATAEEAPASRRAHVAPRRARRRRSRALLAITAVAAAIVLFAGGLFAGGLFNGLAEQRTADQFAALNAAPDVVRLVTPLPTGGSASVVASQELGMSAVVLNDAESLPKGKTYQVWYVDDSGPTSAGTIEPAGASTYRMLEGHYDGDQVAMTIEPDGGSPKPTTDPMILS